MPVSLRAPGATPFSAPPTAWLKGTWHVTHSSLPMWRSKSNVRITYTPLPAVDPSALPAGETDRIDDLVEYQGLDGGSVSTVRGVDKLAAPGAWHWRGKGWLMVASSSWEVLGWGDEGGGWAVTFFAKTLFTPAGVDVYARSGSGLGEELLGEVTKALLGVENEEVRRLAGELFVVKMG